MATIVGKTSDAIDALVNALVQTGAIDGSGNLTLTTKGGTVIAVGNVGASVPAATETIAGILKIATAALVTAGTDDTTAVSPSHLAAVTGPMNTSINTNTTNISANTTAIAGKQASNAHLTAISSMAPTNSDVMQYESGEWSHRTPAQLAADLQNAYPFAVGKQYVTSTYVSSTTPTFYVGAVDPGSVPDGSVWFDTSGG